MLGLKPELILAKKGVRVATKNSARRCLFGPVDHAEIKQTIRKEMLALDTENTQKYNFDFFHEQPLDGPFNWTPVKDCEFVPIAYKMQDFNNLTVLAEYSKFLNMGSLGAEQPAKPKQQARRILKPRLRKPMAELPANAGLLLKEAASGNATESVRVTLKRKQQSQITDFFPQRKLARKEKSSN